MRQGWKILIKNVKELPIISKWKSFAKTSGCENYTSGGCYRAVSKKNSKYATNKMHLVDLLQGCIKKQNNYENKTKHHTTPFG